MTTGQVSFQRQFNEFNQCLTKVIYPAIYTKIQDGANTSGVENYKEFWYALAGLAGIGQNFDGNGAAGRFLTGGSGTVVLSPPATIVKPGAPPGNKTLVAQTPSGARRDQPALPRHRAPLQAARAVLHAGAAQLQRAARPSGSADGGG